MEGIEERWENVMQWSGLTVDDMYMEEEGELRDWEEAVSIDTFLMSSFLCVIGRCRAYRGIYVTPIVIVYRWWNKNSNTKTWTFSLLGKYSNNFLSLVLL